MNKKVIYDLLDAFLFGISKFGFDWEHEGVPYNGTRYKNKTRYQ